jgi:hypothetical protein
LSDVVYGLVLLQDSDSGWCAFNKKGQMPAHAL